MNLSRRHMAFIVRLLSQRCADRFLRLIYLMAGSRHMLYLPIRAAAWHRRAGTSVVVPARYRVRYWNIAAILYLLVRTKNPGATWMIPRAEEEVCG
jgi:hypothetical protein